MRTVQLINEKKIGKMVMGMESREGLLGWKRLGEIEVKKNGDDEWIGEV